MIRLTRCLVLLLLVTSCGELPEPFLGNPGPTGRLLAQPPGPRLAVPPPTTALLPDAGDGTIASSLASALQTQKVPAIAGPAHRGDWSLVTSARLQGPYVIPEFTVTDPAGAVRGKAEGRGVPAAAWSAASADMLQASVTEAAPRIASMLANIQTAIDHSNPNSLYNRTTRVMVADVTGAPGDGDQALTKQIRQRLASLGPAVQTTPDKADFVVQGQVRVVPIAGGKERVEIQWIVKTGAGDERGRVIQLNEIPAGSLSHTWGNVAVLVATEAAGGVNDVLRRQTGHAENGSAPVDKSAAVRGQSGKPLLEGPRSGAALPAR